MGRSGGGRSSGFDPALHPRDAKGRFIRTRHLREAAARARGEGPTSTTGLRNAIRRNPTNTKAGIAGRIVALPPDQRHEVKAKFLNEGKTPAVKAKLERVTTRRMSQLQSEASASARARRIGQQPTGQRSSLTGTNESITDRMIRVKREAASAQAANQAARAQAAQRSAKIDKQDRRREKLERDRRNFKDLGLTSPTHQPVTPINIRRRINQLGNEGERVGLGNRFVQKGATRDVKKAVKRQEQAEQRDAKFLAKRQKQQAQRDARTREIANATGRISRPTSTTGHRNWANSRPMNRPNSPNRNNRNIAERIAQLSNPEHRQRLAAAFIDAGNNKGLRKAIESAEAGHRTELGRAARTSRRQRINTAAAAENPNTARLRRLIARSSEPVRTTADAFTASGVGSRLGLPGYQGSTKQSMGLSKATAEQRLAARIRRLGSTTKAEAVLAVHARHGLGSQTMGAIRAAEATRGEVLKQSRRTATAAAQPTPNPQLVALKAKLTHPKLQGLAAELNNSKFHQVEKLFNKVSGDEFVKGITSGLPSGATTRISLGQGGKTVNWTTSGGGIEDMSRRLHLETTKPWVHHSYFSMQRDHTGGGVGRKAFKANFELYQKIGISHIETQPNIDVGGYTWAKYGFRPLRGGEGNHYGGGYTAYADTVKSFISRGERTGKWTTQNISTRGIVRDHQYAVSPQTVKWLKGLEVKIRSGDREAVWALVDKKQVMKDARGNILKDANGKDMTIGKAVMLGANWYGKLDFEDPVNLKRAMDYVNERT